MIQDCALSRYVADLSVHKINHNRTTSKFLNSLLCIANKEAEMKNIAKSCNNFSIGFQNFLVRLSRPLGDHVLLEIRSLSMC